MTRSGERLRRVASALCDSRTMERVVDPILADLQAEHLATAARGWRGRLQVWRGGFVLWKALGLHCLMQTLQPLPAPPPASLPKILLSSFAAFAVLTGLLTLPPLMESHWPGGLGERLWLTVLLVPQALPLTIPAGICIGIACAMRGRRADPPTLAAVLAVAVLATVTVWTMLEWGMPAANQEFRLELAEQLNGRPVDLEPGLAELGLSRLSNRTDVAAVRQVRMLWAICFATGPLAVFALGVSARIRRFSAAMALSVGASLIYIFALFAVADAVRDGTLRAAGAWLPNIAFALTGALMLRAGGALRAEAGRHQ